jgi:hypothetical protein
MNEAAAPRPEIDRRRAATVALAVLAGLLTWLLLEPSNVKDPSTDNTSTATGVATIKSAAELERLADSIGHPVYWLGTPAGFKNELTLLADGRVFIRYLPPNVRAGDPRFGFTFVDTYPQRGALDTVRAAIRNDGARRVSVAGGGLAVTNRRLPNIVYVAYPGSDYLAEVFVGSPKLARDLVSAGQVQPIKASGAVTPGAPQR